MKEYFPGIPRIQYGGPDTAEPFQFRFYNPQEVLLGKTMEEHLRFSMSYWHTMVGEGTDPFGQGTMERSYGEEDPSARARARADAAFEFMGKLGIRHFCFHDVDVVEGSGSLSELKENLLEMTGYLKEKMQESGIRLLWGTANCFSHPRYMHGAATSPEADIFACAAAQIKNALDATMALGGEGYVFWGGREGYETLLNTDMALEQENLASLMRMAVEYARSRGFEGDFYVEPKPKEPTKHQYDFDAATVAGFLRKYGLDRDFRLNIEANHATLAGHTFQHELQVARMEGLFGSIDANQGDMLLGWDTDQFPTNVYDGVYCMLEVLRAGGFTRGGINFDAKIRRGSHEFEDLVHGYMAGMDTFALGLRLAVKILEDGRLDRFVASRYKSYGEGIGERIRRGTTSLEELEQYALGLPERVPPSGRQEYLEHLINTLMFTGR